MGKFTQERKAILNIIREELRNNNYLPILFNFEKPGSRFHTETVNTLARLARLVVADFTDGRYVLEEVSQIVRRVDIPVKPLLSYGEKEPEILSNLRKHYSIRDTFFYQHNDNLAQDFKTEIISFINGEEKKESL